MTTAAAATARDSISDVDSSPLATRLGATPTDSGVRFALFSTTASRAEVRLLDAATNGVRAAIPMTETSPHHFEVDVDGVAPGALYELALDGRVLPDPYARYLPRGVHGPARVEPRAAPPAKRFVPRPLRQWVIYELHVGTFTTEGTFRAATERLRDLADLGVNAVELMPLAAFHGERGWGYDGVAMFAPHAAYGEPDDLRRFVAEAHAHGIAVLLDVVYNHFGPAGNYLSSYAPEYFRADKRTAWGAAPSYAEPHMRRLALDNARYWLEEFDFDGLRLDATHGIVDDSEVHILTELAELARSLDRPRVLIAEDERNDPDLVQRHGLDGVWADDFHHAVRVLLTGEKEGYFAGYSGTADELARAIERGWLYEGQTYAPTGAPRGRPATLPKDNLVYCIQNHDQIGNRAFGTRLSEDVSPEAYAGASLLLLFLPAIPLLFMGQEWAASSPFLYFTDHDDEVGAAVTRGRREEFKQFSAFRDPAVRERIPDPQARETFERSKLDWREREERPHAAVLTLYRAMLRLRASDAVISAEGTVRAEVRGGLLAVTREGIAGRRLLLFNPTTSALADPRLAYAPKVILTSASIEEARLPAGAAAIIAEDADR